MIFNAGGRTLKELFTCGQSVLENVGEYSYLGIIIKPSGSFTQAVQELYTKSNKAWFAISNTLYCHKKMPIKNAFKIFDSLISPISTYACELWTPFVLKGGSLTSTQDLFSNFGDFAPEKINQRLCRMILSVHKKTSRLAVLGELGRFPLLLNAIIHTIKYEWHLKHEIDSSSIIGLAYSEMSTNNSDN